MADDLQANKALARAFLTALGRGDINGLAAVLAPDAQAIATGTGTMSGTRDREAILSAAGMLGSITRDGIDFEILSTTAEDDRVSVEAQGHSTLVNGTPYNNEYHLLFTMRGGRIARIREYYCTKLTEDAFATLQAPQPA